jgi:hypothetical protein
MRHALCAALAAVTLAAVPCRPCPADGKKDDAVAREVVARLMKAALARDVEAVMKVVDVPWCHDGREIIKDRDRLRDTFRDGFARARKLKMPQAHIRQVGTLESFRRAKKGLPGRKVSLDDVLGKDHRVVFVEIEHDGRFQPTWVGVWLEQGRGKVVGILD